MTKLNTDKNESFQDYNNAENSDDEENFNDLQSRLYAEIYYTPHVEEANTNVANKLFNTKDCLHTNAPSSNSQFDLQDTHMKSNSNQKSTEDLALHKNQSNVIPRGVNDSDNFSHSKEPVNDNINTKKNDESRSSCLNVDDQDETYKNNKSKKAPIECHNQHDHLAVDCSIGNDEMTENFPKPYDSRVKRKKSKKSSNSRRTEVYQQDQSQSETVRESTMDIGDTPSPKNKTKSKVLKKYEFSKKIINKLYMDKQSKSQSEMQEEQQESDNTEMDTRYNVVEKAKKKKPKSENMSTRKSSSNSDSDESIFEVPVPPKPAPEIIELQDSDEETEELNINNTTRNRNASVHVEELPKDNLQMTIEVSTSGSENSPENYKSPNIDMIEIIEESNSVEATELDRDIVLNCTEVQRGASSIEEIREMSKGVQEQNTHMQKTPTEEEVHKNITSDSLANLVENETQMEEDTNNQFNCTSESFILDGGSIIENVGSSSTRVANVDFADDNSVLKYHVTSIKDKRKQKAQDKGDSSESLNKAILESFESEPLFTYDNVGNVENMTYMDLTDTNHTDDERLLEPQTSFDTDKVKTSRKRRRDVLGESEITSKQVRHKSNKHMDDSTFTNSHNMKNFDIEEIQNKMSKDPKMWAILDDDIMPFKRNRFWNVRCSHCHQYGHCRYNCPEPRKLPICHMCGIQGHVETRCPNKMCLTCGKKQGTYRKTCESCRTFYCTTCNSVGHKSTECPDIWRRYHQTTSKSTISMPANWETVMKPSHLLHCCNCAKRGHESSMCQEYRWSPHFPTPSFVSNYMKDSFYTDMGCTDPTLTQDVPNTSSTSNHDIPSTSKTLLAPNNSMKILYSYSSFHTTVPMRHNNEMIRIWNKLQKIDGLLEGRTLPTFLERMPTTIKFRIHMQQDEDRVIVSLTTYDFSPQSLFKILEQWLLTDDDEKDYRMLTDLPINDKDTFIKIIETKLYELRECKDNPMPLWDEVCKWKNALKSNCDNRQLVLEHLISLQKRLIIAMYKQQGDVIIRKLKTDARKLSNSKSNKVVPFEVYLNILYMYNEIFAPHTTRRLQRYMDRLQRNEKKRLDRLEHKQSHQNKKLNKINPNNEGFVPEQIRSVACNKLYFPEETGTLQAENSLQDANAEHRTEPLSYNQKQNEDISIAKGTIDNPEISEEIYNDHVPVENITNIRAESIPGPSASTSLTHTHFEKKVTSQENVQTVNNTNETFEVEKQTIQIEDNMELEKRKKSGKKKKKKSKENIVNKKLVKSIIYRAFKLGISDLSKLAKDLIKKMKQNAIKEQDITILHQLVTIEEEHRKQVESLYKCLK